MSRLQEGKRLRQLKAIRKERFDFSYLPDEPVEKGWSFSQSLFNDEVSVKIRNAAKETKFIQGMATGTLDPDDYGGYMVQDAAYCFNAVEAFDHAAKEIQLLGKPEFSLLYRVQSESYKQYNQEFVKTWRLKNTDSVVMGPAADMYVGYEAALSRQRPKFLAIAMLPCTMLWPWIASEMICSVSNTNPYYGWFEDNKPDPGHKSRLEKFVDFFFSEGEREEALVVFHEGMINELNFFRDACDETLYYYSFFNV
ncbi:uncharacterized protein [Porites lutea]|uniref:uncharacterized protein n=1 Tax=Porites lutea TaxID=51062 RepID=UPI003CC6DCD0